ncbi:hypothetical protein Ocin01_17542 [Orchesella cincta]|uniref:Uncharacterized protein n=1 Tax=Orchesella cincta TaxID=48709 RepID=A0A1D2M889_ORCCI|nr:hypothetical protein Ocin01_17542 [Orchesella cincta]
MLPSKDVRAMALRACPPWEKPVSVDLEEFSFLWIVNNFSTLSGLSEIRSPVFRGGGPTKTTAVLFVLLVAGDYGDFEGEDPVPVRANYQVSILDAGGQPAKKSGGEDKPTAEFKSSGT